MKMLSNLDLNKNEIQNVRVQNLATAPSNPVIGQVYYNTTDKTAYVYDGTSWRDMAEIIDLSTKQDTLVSGNNIKTINGTSLLGSGDISISSGGSYTAGSGISIEGGVISSTNGYLDATTSVYKLSLSNSDGPTVSGVLPKLRLVIEDIVSAIDTHYGENDGFVPVLVVGMDISDPLTLTPTNSYFSRLFGVYIMTSWTGEPLSSGTITFTNITPQIDVSLLNENSYSKIVMYDKPYINITLEESGEHLSVSGVTILGYDGETIANYLDTNREYSSAYTPMYDGSPANKKYVDDSASSLLSQISNNYINKTSIGNAGGVASLDENGKVPSSQLPSYVDDVIEGYYYNGQFYSNEAHTDLITPEVGKIYVDLTSNNTYRWGGTTYVEISQSTIHKFVKTITAQSNGNAAVSHNLGTEDVIVSVYDMSGNQVIVGVNIMNSSNITLEFANVKNGTEDFKVVIIA